MNNSFAEYFQIDDKKIKRQKYYAFKTAVESYNGWISLKNSPKEKGEENLSSPEEILKKIGCYTLIISLLEDRIRVYFWWVSYHDKQELIETNGELRCASEQEFNEYSLEPSKDKNFKTIATILKKLEQENYFDSKYHQELKRIFDKRNEIIHNTYINHVEITPDRVDTLFNEFRSIDNKLKGFQRKCRQKKKMEVSSSS